MITREEILKGQECPPELEQNLEHHLICLNKFRAIYGIPMYCTSGLRSLEHNIVIGGKPGSAHLSAQASDWLDDKGDIKAFIASRPDTLEECGLYMEDPLHTPTWCHLQSRPPVSNKRIFIP